MRYKLLGNSGLRLSELCLGTMTFGGDFQIEYSLIERAPEGELLPMAADLGLERFSAVSLILRNFRRMIGGYQALLHSSPSPG
jgi:aryl-alcohol dehydrogenase-like predicted oxidoreductase